MHKGLCPLLTIGARKSRKQSNDYGLRNQVLVYHKLIFALRTFFCIVELGGKESFAIAITVNELN